MFLSSRSPGNRIALGGLGSLRVCDCRGLLLLQLFFFISFVNSPRTPVRVVVFGMAAGDEQAAAEVLKGLARHLNCLNEENKSTRKRAIELIKRETIDRGLASSVLQEVFAVLLKPLLKCLSDPMERCRETAITIITEFIRCVPKPEECLSYLMPCLAQRLGEKEIQEPAEELRLSCVEMLTLTSEVCGKHLAPYVNEMVNILQRTVVDPFPDAKRESCTCIITFAKCVPGSCPLLFALLLTGSVAMVTRLLDLSGSNSWLRPVLLGVRADLRSYVGYCLI